MLIDFYNTGILTWKRTNYVQQIKHSHGLEHRGSKLVAWLIRASCSAELRGYTLHLARVRKALERKCRCKMAGSYRIREFWDQKGRNLCKGKGGWKYERLHSRSQKAGGMVGTSTEVSLISPSMTQWLLGHGVSWVPDVSICQIRAKWNLMSPSSLHHGELMDLIMFGYCAGKYYGFVVAITIPYSEDSSFSQNTSTISGS